MTRISRILLSLVACSAIGLNSLFANEVLFRRGYAEIIAEQDDIYTIRMKLGYKTMFLFPADERILRVEVGIRGSVLEVKYGANWVAVRPSEEKVATNMHVATDKGRVYSFDLVEGEKKEFHRKVVVLRPDMDLEPEQAAAPLQQKNVPAGTPGQNAPVKTSSGRNVTVDSLDNPAAPGQVAPSLLPTSPNLPAVTPGVLTNKGVPGVEFVRKADRNYKIENQRPKLFEVDSVVNDGERTFVRFKSALNESPLFYRIDANGKRSILTYRQESGTDSRDRDVFVIPRLVDKGVVRVGDTESIFTWLKTL